MHCKSAQINNNNCGSITLWVCRCTVLAKLNSAHIKICCFLHKKADNNNVLRILLFPTMKIFSSLPIVVNLDSIIR